MNSKSNTNLQELYTTMKRIRVFEERVAELFVRGVLLNINRVPCFLKPIFNNKLIQYFEQLNLLNFLFIEL